MPAPHIPNLLAITNVADPTSRFYAIIGVLVSLSAALEQNLFEIFAVGVRMTEDEAAPIYYRVRSEIARAGMTDAAIQHYLKNHPAMIKEWEGLRDRMGPASEPARYRNLVAHNPVKVTLAVPANIALMGISFSGAPVAPPPPRQFSHSVHQDPLQVKAKTQKALDADFLKLRDACYALAQLHYDLTDWLQRLP